ncbi:helix-turn-helix domain-containing protein [Lutimonas zeaxanthinifaciens]|uniref:helix-turn-helix domain-containing protein n=1 Tax=Lutimonas zeaxanthinifaciens TaxID=3060215 RepID=UPI00265C90DD|nr:helix-turn-helix transcriptional regulator [Lutimonas sp. YSD2104]WKK64562.1 helix-turn-helix transcriptional regulator [Lutimonas sp. YSD2104]
MINNTEFSERLKRIMEFYQLSASGFADRIKVPRSSISHLLSGRNKPSLDFVMKVIKEFDEVELYWLLNGKGNFPMQASLISENISKPDAHVGISENINEGVVEEKIISNDIERIVIFFKNGTFKEYIK